VIPRGGGRGDRVELEGRGGCLRCCVAIAGGIALVWIEESEGREEERKCGELDDEQEEKQGTARTSGMGGGLS